MDTDTFILVVATNAATLALATAYYITRVNELRVEHVEAIQAINADYLMQRRTYGAVPMEDLLGREAGSE